MISEFLNRDTFVLSGNHCNSKILFQKLLVFDFDTVKRVCWNRVPQGLPRTTRRLRFTEWFDAPLNCGGDEYIAFTFDVLNASSTFI